MESILGKKNVSILTPHDNQKVVFKKQLLKNIILNWNKNTKWKYQ
jgi:hypothetical protein